MEHPALRNDVPVRTPVTPRRILLVYVGVAVVWIALSDAVAAALFPAPGELAVVETLKGWGFVGATALLLALLLGRYERDRARQMAALAERERTFRLLAEHARDVIFRYRVAPASRVDYLSPSIEAALGYPPERFYREPALLDSLVHPGDLPVFRVDPADVPAMDLAVVRFRAANGRWVAFEVHLAVAPSGPDGAVAIEGVARDITERQRHEVALRGLNRVLRTLSAANRALVRAETEDDLLATICRTIVEEGGFRFAWVGFVEPASGTVRPAAHAGREDGYLSGIRIESRDSPNGRGPAGTAIREGRPVISRNVAADEAMAPWRSEAFRRGYASVVALPLDGQAGIFGVLVIYGGETDAFGPDEVALLEELAADLAYGVDVLRAREAHAAGEAERLRLAAAVAQSGESVMITDPAGRIEYVNPAFERVSGYTREDVLGRNPRLLQSGVQAPSFYTAMWQTLTAGRTWVGDLVNRRKDGSLFTEEAAISPIRGAAGALTGYAAVKRDVTRERAAEERDRTRARERALIAEAMRALRPEHSLEETAAAVCQQLVRLPDAAVAWFMVFEGDGSANPLAGAAGDGTPAPLRRVPVARAAQLRARAQEGPWVERWVPRRGHLHPEEARPSGIRAIAYAPFQVDGEVAGLLALASADRSGAVGLTERLPALVEFAGISGAVLGPSLLRRGRHEQAQGRIRRIIDEEAFRPVFQPIVDLGTGQAEGYEALTRFADGTAPDAQFAEAARAGLGVELEIATLRAALAAATSLPDRAFLNVNVSPALITAHEPLASIVRASARAIILEVTEHEAITDYATFRQAVAAIGPAVRLAVDDAGAGFASLRHVLELHPDIVKIDRSLVEGLEGDQARQALVTGFRHLADSVDCRLVAEGIETDAELAALRTLGVTLGQGYLLGRPVPAAELAVTARGA